MSIWRKHQIIHDSQEGFRVERSTSRQLQLLFATLEDARFTNQDIYLLYIDFHNAFESLGHTRLLAIIKKPWLSKRRSNTNRKYILTFQHDIYWRTLWKNKTNTNTKRHHTRRHTQTIPLLDFLRTITKIATKR